MQSTHKSTAGVLNRRHRFRFLVLAVAFESGLGVLAWFIGWLVGVPIVEQFSWSLLDLVLGMAAALPLLGIFLLLIRARTPALDGLRRSVKEVIQPMFRACGLAELAVISVTAGVGEETLFRGVVQTATGHWLGPLPALILTSISFGLLHPLSKMYILLACGFGLYLGACWLASGNLLVVVVAHALYDFVALAYLVGNPLSDGTVSGESVS